MFARLVSCVSNHVLQLFSGEEPSHLARTESKRTMDKFGGRPGDVRGDHAVGSRPEGMAGWERLRVGDIEDGTQAILLKGIHERVGDHDGASRCVDEESAGFHQGKFCGSELPLQS